MKKLLMLSTLMMALPGCFNTNQVSQPVSSSRTPSSTTASSTVGPAFTIISQSVTYPAAGAAATDLPTQILNFNAVAAGTQTLVDVCQVPGAGASSSRACKCRYSWSETNLTDGSIISRTVDTALTQVTTFQVQCEVPTVYTTEISDGTILKVSVVPDTVAGNVSGFTTNVFSYTKTSSAATGDFRDVEGRTYKNIFHYVCYDKFQRALSIDHAEGVAATNNATGASVYAKIANKFTTGVGAGAVNAYSAQSYYYDFYVRSNETGSINSGTESFTCPMVSVPGIGGGLPSYYPMDSQFALALNPSKDFNLQVSSSIVLAVAGAPSGNVLGYAAKPNSDGTCPAFLDSNNNIRRTFRLRQYASAYPIRYDADGRAKDTSQKVNVVYVLDRPVDKSGIDPLKPITRTGPKPCPYAYKTSEFGYRCMSDSTLNNKNIDGTKIPSNASCPVYPPPPSDPSFYGTDGSVVVRPYKSYVPNYLENTAFQACAFPSSTPVDPEIVVSHDDSVFSTSVGPHDFYCAKYYPSAGSILAPPGGDPFDKPPSECDLSSAANAIKTNKSYACLKTYNPSGTAFTTPQAGCCQICSGANCTAAGGGVTPAGRNAAFSPPQDVGNPATAFKQLPRAIPNTAGSGGCFDPTEP